MVLWLLLIFPASLILTGLGAYPLGLKNRPGPPISHSFVRLGWAVFIGPAAAM
jgi:hypothetical protein